MELKCFSIDDIELFRDDDDVDFAYVKIYVLSEGNNSHKNPIPLEVLKRDANTILGKFIIGKFSEWAQDVESHELDEVILGYIPNEQKVKFEEKDGKTFLVVEGVLSKLYATQVVQMFKNLNFRNVSAEFSCEETEEDSYGNREILSLHFHGVTILGLKYNPSCKGAEMKVVKFAEMDNGKDIKKLAEKRKEEMNLKSYKMDKSAKAMTNKNWNGEKTKHDILKDKNFKTHAKSVFLKLEDGWEDKKISALKYPVMSLVGDTWVYNREGLSSAKAYANNPDSGDKEVAEKINRLYNELKLNDDKEEKMADLKDKEKNLETKDKEEEKKMSEGKDEKEKPSSDDKEKKMSDCEDPDDDDKDDHDDDDEHDNSDDKEKKMSEDANLDVAASLAFLKNETEDYKAMIREMYDNDDKPVIMEKFLALVKERDELKKYKEEREEEEKVFAIDKLMASVKEDLDEKQFNKFKAEGMACKLSEVEKFSTKVKAFAYENSKSKTNKETQKDGIMRFEANMAKETNKEKTVDDIYNEYL